MKNKKTASGKPYISCILLAIIVLGCAFAELIMTREPSYMDLTNCLKVPCAEFPFGTDSLGRDIFSMIWYGGRISLAIGILSTVISTFIAVIYGTFCAMSPRWLDHMLVRFAEIILSIPNLLLILSIQAIFGDANVISISAVIGITSWPSIAQVIRTEVRQMRRSEYILASRTLGGGFIHILTHHMIPGIMPSVTFMVIMNVRSAIIAESTLSFIGIGLPVDVISWGSMLSITDSAVLTGAWWILVIPGLFLIITIFAMTEIGNYLKSL